MSTSFIYHALGLTGYEYVHQKFINGSILILINVRPTWRFLCCPVCQSKHIIRRGVVLIRTVPVGRKPVWILVESPRLLCFDCKLLRQIHTGIATPKRSYTRAFERFALVLYRVMTLKDIAAFLGISWDCVKDIVKRNLNRGFSKPSLNNVMMDDWTNYIDELRERAKRNL